MKRSPRWGQPPQPLTDTDRSFMDYLLQGIRAKREAVTDNKPIPRQGPMKRKGADQ